MKCIALRRRAMPATREDRQWGVVAMREIKMIDKSMPLGRRLIWSITCCQTVDPSRVFQYRRSCPIRIELHVGRPPGRRRCLMGRHKTRWPA